MTFLSSLPAPANGRFAGANNASENLTQSAWVATLEFLLSYDLAVATLQEEKDENNACYRTVVMVWTKLNEVVLARRSVLSDKRTNSHSTGVTAERKQ